MASKSEITLQQKQQALAELGVLDNKPSLGIIGWANSFAGKQAARVVTGFSFATDAYEEERAMQQQLLIKKRNERTARLYESAIDAGLIPS